MNDSTSPTSPAWPTHWPRDSFTGLWTWLVAGLLVALVVAALLAGLQAAARIGAAHAQPPSPIFFDVGLLLQVVLEGAIVAFVLGVLPRLAKRSLRDLGFRMPTWQTLGIALLGAIAMAIVADGLAQLIDQLLHSNHQQDAVLIFKEMHDRTSLTLLAVYAIVLAPFFEETIFRVFFFNLGLRYGGFWAGAICSGLLFGAAHGDPYAAVPLALGGMVLCAVYYRSRNAWASMATHGLFNALSVAALFFAPHLVS